MAYIIMVSKAGGVPGLFSQIARRDKKTCEKIVERERERDPHRHVGGMYTYSIRKINMRDPKSKARYPGLKLEAK